MDDPRIIHAPINIGRRYAVTTPITQYDYGYLLLPEGVELPTTYEIDFSNDEKHGTSLIVYGDSEGAEVPEELIRTGKDVYAFYYHVGDGYGKTEFTWRLPNKCRPSRDGQTPTPSQQSSIDQLIVRSNVAVETAEEKAEEADTSARNAKEDADRAERAKTGAETAQGKAEEAQESAKRAKDDAQASERNASESERKAKGYADTASEKADAIIGLTATAQTLPEGSSATASYDAETGVMSFGIPKGKDGTDGDDGYSPTASVTKSGKVATITITDKNGTTSAQVEDGEDGTDGIDGISPSVSVTDITGGHRVVITDKDGAKSFDVEDGATGATPNLTIGTVETLEPTDDATATITGTAENPVLNFGIPKGEQGEVTLEDYYKAFPTDTASGSIASFSDGADNLPLKSLVVDINPIQDLSHGDPSPTNICPISGHEEVNVYDDSLYGGEIEWNQRVDYTRISLNQNEVKCDIENDGTLSFTGEIKTTYRSFYTAQHVISGHRYLERLVIVANPNNMRLRFHVFQGGMMPIYTTSYNKSMITTAKKSNAIGMGIEGFTAGDVLDGIKIKVGLFDLTQMFGETVADYIYSLEAANEGAGVAWFDNLFPNDYYPYNIGEKTTISAVNGKPYTHVNIPLGQTVYGGKLDVLTGELVVDRVHKTYNGTENWNASNLSDPVYYALWNQDKSIGNQDMTQIADWLVAGGNDYQRWETYRAQTNGAIVVGNLINEVSGNYKFADASEFKAYLAEHPLTVCYKIATPITIQLTPHEVNSLLGQNNIFADSGDTEVEYRADTKLYIERLTAPDSADMIADANITSGKYFMVGNSLYKATANIANGASIIVGTNCIRKSLSEALNEINA